MVATERPNNIVEAKNSNINIGFILLSNRSLIILYPRTQDDISNNIAINAQAV